MAIERNHKGFDSKGRIDKAGEYVVTIEKLETGHSKSGKEMLTITFVTDDEKRIKGYYVRTLEWHMKALNDLKVACGLDPKLPSQNLFKKRCGIAVGEQSPTEDGKIFMQIEGYGKETDVEGHMATPGGYSDEVPF